jgi:glutamate N-acetyltransferase/amino-acid N-acetyltransferase
MTVPGEPPQQIYLPKGFSFSAVCAGVKASGRLDLAMVEADPGTTAAAVFSRNRVVAAPIDVGRAHLAVTGGRVRAVIVNSGNANCATGEPGVRVCNRICRQTARLLNIRNQDVFPSSTGIIGVPMPADKILVALPQLIATRQRTEQGVQQFAGAIMTTDTRPKLASARFRASQREVNLMGIAKGSGMIHPQLATMLVYLFTDIAAGTSELKRLLRQTCDSTFNCISVDGDTSTNDTVLLLASGKSEARLNDLPVRKKFENALLGVCQSLAEQIVQDGEGVRHVIRLFVERAKSREEALRVARAVAHSLLVKTAWAGADPNWGRILAALGNCGVSMDPKRVDILIGNQLVCRRGVASPFDKAKAHLDLTRPRCDIHIRLQRGRSSAVFFTTDLTADYVRINADYST